MELRRAGDRARADRAPLAIVAREELRSAPFLDHGRELPAEIDRVAEPGVHAESAGRRDLMDRIAGEEHATAAIAFGEDALPPPDVDVDPFDLEIAAERAAQISPFVDAL